MAATLIELYLTERTYIRDHAGNYMMAIVINYEEVRCVRVREGFCEAVLFK